MTESLLFNTIMSMKIDFAHLWDWADKHSASIVAIATVALAIITLLYLRETKKLRLQTQKAISVDISPMVFIDNVKTVFIMNNKKSCIDVRTSFAIKNSGKTEARNIQFSYVLTYKNGKEVRASAIPAQYLFPGQQCVCNTELITLFVKPEEFIRLKEKLQSKSTIIIKEITFLKEVREELEGLELSIELKYEDGDGEKVKWPHFFQYSIPKNSWVRSMRSKK